MRSSLASAAGGSPRLLRGGVGASLHPVSLTLGAGSFSTVSRLFRPCNKCPVGGARGSGSYAERVTDHPAPRSTTEAPTGLEPAGWGRRIVALFVDWLSCLAVAQLLVAAGVVSSNPNNLVTMALFIAESALFTALAGGSFGKLATRIRVVRHSGGPQPVGLLPAVLRTVLVALVIPPLLTFDGRGLHDLAARTRTVLF